MLFNLIAKKLSNRYLGKHELNDSSTFSTSSDVAVKNSNIYGFVDQSQFTGDSQGLWEKKTLNIAAQKYAYRLVAGYRVDSDNQEEIGYIKDLDVVLSKPGKLRSRHFESRSKGSTSKKRISGRI